MTEITRRITALTLQKHNRQRVNIYLDGEFAFGLAYIVAAWLQIGMELDEEKISALKAEDEREAAYQRALNWIDYRPHSATEIRQKLEHQAASQETIFYVMDRLERSHLVDDSAFAQNWVENRAELRPRSRRALAFELRKRGIQPDIIDQSIAAMDDNEMAYQAAQRQVHKLSHLDWKDFRQKMLRHLAQRGFNYETSSEATQRVWKNEHEMEPDFDDGE